MIGAEIDMIVTDSLRALELYEKIFDAERIEVTAYPRGLNEVVLTIYGTRFHLLDENPEFKMFAPEPGDKRTIWLNLVIANIKSTYGKAVEAGCAPIQPIVDMPGMGVMNAMIMDPFGYIWMLHEITREVSFEQRSKIMEEQLGIKPEKQA